MVLTRLVPVLAPLTDEEVYLWWARHKAGVWTAEQELIRRMLERKINLLDGALFTAELRQVPGSSRSEFVIHAKEK